MTAPYTVAQYQRQVFVGNKGATATTQVLTLIKCDLKKPIDFTPTDRRGDGTSIPLKTEQPSMRGCDITFSTRNEANGSNATLTANLIAYASDPTNPICALKIVSYPGGPVEFDGDVHLVLNDPDSRELEFEAHVSTQGGRDPVF